MKYRPQQKRRMIIIPWHDIEKGYISGFLHAQMIYYTLRYAMGVIHHQGTSAWHRGTNQTAIICIGLFQYLLLITGLVHSTAMNVPECFTGLHPRNRTIRVVHADRGLMSRYHMRPVLMVTALKRSTKIFRLIGLIIATLTLDAERNLIPSMIRIPLQPMPMVLASLIWHRNVEMSHYEIAVILWIFLYECARSENRTMAALITDQISIGVIFNLTDKMIICIQRQLDTNLNQDEWDTVLGT